MTEYSTGVRLRTKLVSLMDEAPHGRRVGTSDDVEVSTYLEIARGKTRPAGPTGREKGAAPGEAAPSPASEAIVILDFGSQYSLL
ncbi:MAG TPA: hypothetical protein VJM69_01515, partial [Dehalococcoidia bacterium]|nr:hypothetical protein [Dehalococcoidia bacterium]